MQQDEQGTQDEFGSVQLLSDDPFEPPKKATGGAIIEPTARVGAVAVSNVLLGGGAMRDDGGTTLAASGGATTAIHGGNIDHTAKLRVVSECASGSGDVCSPKNVLQIMRQYIASKNDDASNMDDSTVVSTVKGMLGCETESCVLGKSGFTNFSKSDLSGILRKFFKPKGPNEEFGLLSNFNIDEVLDQFVTRFPSRKFLHIPFQMRDFAKVQSELATIDLVAALVGPDSKYNSFGVVLNTDFSSNGGIHWFCIFGEVYADHISIEYFNSSGNQPLPEVQEWLNETKHKLAKASSKDVKVSYTTGIRFQSDRHSCGVYCLCYIWLRLEKVAPDWFSAATFNDKHMHAARKTLFRSGL